MTLSIFKRRSGARGFRSSATRAIALSGLFVIGMLVTLVGGAAAAATAVPLGTADSFAVLAGAGITNTGATTINGDLGSYPTLAITGTATLTVNNGTNHGGDAVTQAAKDDLVIAYNNAAGQGPISPIVANLGGQVLAPGVYNSASSIGLTGTLTLDGGGDPNAVFVFQAGSTLTTATSSQVSLINGAQSCNVFWQIGSSATLGTYSTLRGSILALTAITVTTGVTVDGRVLARNAAVTLDTNTITKPSCLAATTTTDTTTTDTTTTDTTTTDTTTTATTTTGTTTTDTTTATDTTTTTEATTTTAAPDSSAAQAAAAGASVQATVATAAANQAEAAAGVAAKAATEANAEAAAAAASEAAAAATRAKVAATKAAKLAARAKIKAARVAAARAAAAAKRASVAAAKAAASARLAATRAGASSRGHARPPAIDQFGFTG